MKEILINNIENQKNIFLIEDGQLVEKYIEDKEKEKIEGNIYIGIVKDILPGMQVAFIDIGKEESAFIPLKDLLPHLDIKSEGKIEKKSILDIIKPNMPILAQVKRDYSNYKGAKISTHISLDGRYIILMPNTDIITISKKIVNKGERERLLNIVKNILPANFGAIIRTASENQEECIIKEDILSNIKKWDNITKTYKKSINCNNIPKLIYVSHNIIQKMIIDLADKDLRNIEVNNIKDYESLNKIIEAYKINTITINLKDRVDLIENKIDLKKQIEKIYTRKVWLKCGGFIAIDKTEALTAIDVNSGRFIGKDDVNKTIFKVNKEAAIEIAKQIRLRDIGGIIIIDFIDMQEEERIKLIEIIEEEFKKDRAKTQVIGFSKLNLLEITRKNIYNK